MGKFAEFHGALFILVLVKLPIFFYKDGTLLFNVRFSEFKLEYFESNKSFMFLQVYYSIYF